MNRRFEKIGDIVFPVTTLDNGVTFLDYPMCPPRVNTGKTMGIMPELMRMMKDRNITITFNSEYEQER